MRCFILKNEKISTDECQEVEEVNEDDTASEDVEQSTEENLTLEKVDEMVGDPKVGTLMLENKKKVNQEIPYRVVLPYT